MGNDSSKKSSTIPAGVPNTFTDRVPGHPPKIGNRVQTPYGAGTIEDYRESDEIYVVVMDWELADGAKVRTYCQVDSVWTADEKNNARSQPASYRFPLVLPAGTRVASQFGPGEIQQYRVGDGAYAVKLDWQLDGGVHAMAYVQYDQIKPQVKFADGDYVSTHYGTGVLSHRKSDGMHVVRICQLSGAATAFLQPSAINCKIKAVVGQWVATPYGVGLVERFRASDGIYVVNTPTAKCFLNEESIDHVFKLGTRPKKWKGKKLEFDGEKSDCSVM
jgi:hypothetical protein